MSSPWTIVVRVSDLEGQSPDGVELERYPNAALGTNEYGVTWRDGLMEDESEHFVPWANVTRITRDPKTRIANLTVLHP